MSTKPAGYSTTQIALHWIIAVLVIFQLIMGEDIKPAYRAFSRGNTPAEADLFWANIHVYVGIAIFVLALLRVVVLLRRGAPEPPADEHRHTLQHQGGGRAHATPRRRRKASAGMARARAKPSRGTAIWATAVTPMVRRSAPLAWPTASVVKVA